MTLYKWLSNGNKPAHGGNGEWGVPKNGKPGKWWKVRGKLVPCHNGLHLCRESDLLRWVSQDLYEVEHRGELIEADDKVVAREARLVKHLDGWNLQTTRLWAADCAERALARVGNPDPRSVAAVWVTRAVAYGLADRAAAWSAASAAESAARSAAESTESAAWSAVWSAAWSAARRWQCARLLEYARGEVDLGAIEKQTKKWLKENVK
ncbi:MAG TPA: hypothetical protein VM537_37095 [Anaerolineae bacterium]|nr:hypothetical protein [Anaerolineae bacterium]